MLAYLIEARAFIQTVAELQAHDSLPRDEPFDYRDIVEYRSGPRPSLVNDLASPSRQAIWRAYEHGQLAEGFIQRLSMRWHDGWAEGWAWVRAREDMFLFASARLRSYPMFFCGISPSELAEDLSASAIGDQLAAFDRGEAVLIKASDVGKRLAQARARRSELEDPDSLDHMTWCDHPV
ncbi:MAG TPA: hypothetical protein VKY90_01595 [Candidatus Dormibacteraeota bacterium]|nr:hypothetical protein [Candidatus Dormibacteraeota bacterium]